MSIEYQAVLVVGLPFSEVKNAEELVDKGTFDLIQPYFDAPYEHCLVGVPTYYSGEFSYSVLGGEDFDFYTDEAVGKFKRYAVTPLEPKLYLSVDSY